MENPTETPRRILVAEDVGDSRQLLVRWLQRLTDAEVHEARDGPSALDTFRRLQPQLTFLDLEMPGLDGMGVLAKIREENGVGPFVAIVSGHSESAIVRRASELEVSSYVVKPYSGARLLEVIVRYIEKTGDRAMLKSYPKTQKQA